MAVYHLSTLSSLETHTNTFINSADLDETELSRRQTDDIFLIIFPENRI